MNAQIKVTAVERKEGTAKTTGKPYTKFIVHSEGGPKYDTFDAALANLAYGAVGQFANVEYETTQWGNDLKTFAVANGAAPPEPAFVPAPPTSTIPEAAPQDGPDWERIGLQKTRCALWAALFSSGTLTGMPESAAITLGVGLVRGAEEDIFHRAPAQKDDSIPF